MSGQGIFTGDFKAEPYWWDHTPRPLIEPPELPASVDVAIVGSGYTGLNAAIETARGGRSTLVFDAEDAGFGCSTRNGGQISTSVKPSLAELTRKYGAETGFAILKEGHSALSWMAEFVAREEINCDFIVPGRFHAAHTPKAFDALVKHATSQPKGLEVPYTIVDLNTATISKQTKLGRRAVYGDVTNPAVLASAGIESADAAFLASIAAYDQAQVLLTGAVVNTYTTVRSLEEQLRIAKENVDIQRRSYEIAEVLYENGADSELDKQ